MKSISQYNKGFVNFKDFSKELFVRVLTNISNAKGM